jgi:DNA-binding XRE family transcriptional regulator
MRAHYYWYEGDPRPQDYWDIRRRFRALRQKAKLSQHKLGELIDLRLWSVSRIENGHVVPHVSTWLRFRALERKHLAPPINFPANWFDEDA